MQMHIHTHLKADLTGSDGMGLRYMETSFTESRLSIMSFKTNSLQYKMIPKVDSDSLLHLSPSLSRHTQIKVSWVTIRNRCRRQETGHLEELALSDFPRCFRWTVRSYDIQSVFSVSRSVESFMEGCSLSLLWWSEWEVSPIGFWIWISPVSGAAWED